MTKAEKASKLIAHHKLGIRKLETQHSDRLDFHTLAVWQIKEALELAFELGTMASVSEEKTDIESQLRTQTKNSHDQLRKVLPNR